MFVLEVVLFAVGVTFLIVGANLLVSASSRLATRIGISTAAIGLTVVAFGTGAPELAVGIEAALTNRPQIALGNVIGSNIVNLLVVLGIAALVSPVKVSTQMISRDAPVMVAVSVLLLVLGADGKISRIDGILLLCCFVSYTLWVLRQGRRQAVKDQSARGGSNQSVPGGRISRSNTFSFLLLVLGLALLYQGSLWVVEGAVNGARYLGMSELVVSLTIVAVSTSLPEIATTLTAGLRKKPDLGVGNVVGSNIFNILVVVGFAGLLAPDGLSIPKESIGVDIPVLIAAAVACLPIFWTGQIMSRWEGVLFLVCYGCYTVYLILNAIESGILPFYESVMTRVVIPIAVALVVTLFIITWIRARNARS